MTRISTVMLLLLCVAILMLWGCPSRQQTDQAEQMMPEPGGGMMGGEHMAGEHMAGEHMAGDQDPGEHIEGQAELSGEVLDGVRVVEVEAKRYKFIPSTIVVKAEEPVRLEVTATDVEHGIDIEGMDIDVRLPVGETQTIEFTPEQPGDHHVHCSVFCGPGHGDMHATLIVVE